MDGIKFTLHWMLYNISLAIIPVMFGLFMYQAKTKFFKYLFGLVWILFLPNTIYILTDIIHFPKDWVMVNDVYKPVFIFTYILLMITGIGTFVFSMYPLELMLRKLKKKSQIIEKDLILIGVNILVAFGMVLGRVQRLNSWDVFFNIPKVIEDAIQVMLQPYLLSLFLLFSIACNIIYFLFRNAFRKYEKQFFIFPSKN